MVRAFTRAVGQWQLLSMHVEGAPKVPIGDFRKRPKPENQAKQEIA
jgi:hypothetical protein